MSEQEQKYESGEWWYLRKNNGHNAEFGKIITVLLHKPNEEYLVKCLDNDPTSPCGFRIRLRIFSRFGLVEKASDNLHVPQKK